MKRMTRIAFGLLAAAFTVSCAQSNGDINRVQPNVMKKTDLLGAQWYFRNTVTWTPATTGFTFTGETGALEKLVFEVTENSLIGYRSYPYLPGSETNVNPSSIPSGTTTRFCDTAGKCAEPQQFYGAPVVAYNIVSHFDVQRSYSAATGEPSNVIVENSSDRPWHEREFMRVDWSANLLNPGKSMLWGTVQNPAGASTINSWIQPNEPGTDPYDWPVREYKADGSLAYFDFTGRFYVRPTTTKFDDGTPAGVEYPNCYLFGGEQYDCTSQQINLRTSLARVEPNQTNQYEPLVYSNEAMNKFGYFRTERLTYDREHGITETGRLLLANRFRIWKQAYRTREDGSPNKDQVIPFAEREVKPIVYYVSPARRTQGNTHYQQYLEAARDVEKHWDVAFRRAVAAAKGTTPDKVPQVLYICESPVPEKDTLTGAAPAAACGAPGFEARMGDVRYSFLYTITEPVPNGLLGYGPSSADPETGEIISANANVYTGAVDSSAQSVLTQMDFLVGDKSIDDIISGKDVKDYVMKNPAYTSVLKQTTGTIQAELQGIPQRTDEETVGAFDRPSSYLRTSLDKLRVAGGLPKASSSSLRAAAQKLAKFPSMESALLDNPELEHDVLGMLPGVVASAATANADTARNLKRQVLLQYPEFQEKFNKARIRWARENSITLQEFVDRELFGVAYTEQNKRRVRITELQAKPNVSCNNKVCTEAEARVVADNEIRRRFQQNIWRATAEHEIGHTFGLRHNFQGSFDAMNYLDDYWKLKQPTLTVSQGGVPKVPRTPADLKRASDGTESQLTSGMHDYEYSSIMDYGGKQNASWKGVGKYDEAAIIFAYSGDTAPGYVEVFQNPRRTAQSFNGSDGATLSITGAGHDIPVVNAARTNPGIPNYTERFHYSTLPLHFGTGSDIGAVITDGIAKLKQRTLVKWSDVKAKQEALRAKLASDAAITDADTAEVPAEVPYMFCTDDHEGAVLSCNMWDRGADYYEMTRTWLETYWNGYFFNHFKRDRYYFSSDRATSAAFNTFGSAGAVYKHWVHALYGRNAPGQEGGADYRSGPFGYDPLVQDTWTMATLDGINNLLRVMSVPPAGFFMRRTVDPAGGTVPRWEIISEGVDFDALNESGRETLANYYRNNGSYRADQFAVLPRGEARAMYSRYDYKSGFGFMYRMVEAGHYNDQYGAMIAAVDPAANFLSVDTYADENRYAIPYYLIFKKELGDMFGAIWSSDEPHFRPTMFFSKDSTGNLTQTPSLQFQTKVKGTSYISGFDYPKPEVPDLANTFDAPANIQVTWTSRIYALYLGMALFSVNYDVEYAKQNQIFKLGGGEQIDITAGYHAVQVEDFTTGSVYAAVEKDLATPAERTPALRMIAQAQSILAVVNDPRLDLPQAEWTNPARLEAKRKEFTEYFRNTIRDLDLMRGMYAIYGHPF